jgi:hypothetical protein
MTPFNWGKKGQEVQLTTLKDLLDLLINIPLENIEQEIKQNIIKGNLLSWMEDTFPKELILIVSIKKALKEFTPQQIREILIRELRSRV